VSIVHASASDRLGGGRREMLADLKKLLEDEKKEASCRGSRRKRLNKRGGRKAFGKKQKGGRFVTRLRGWARPTVQKNAAFLPKGQLWGETAQSREKIFSSQERATQLRRKEKRGHYERRLWKKKTWACKETIRKKSPHARGQKKADMSEGGGRPKLLLQESFIMRARKTNPTVKPTGRSLYVKGKKGKAVPYLLGD